MDKKIIIQSNNKKPRTGAFEVEIDGVLVFSKFKTSIFPTSENVNSWFD
tara:strand:+ start:472 stop:618 length:147 start_codon:yes stop_codon:yes gene_type:complete